MLFVLKLTAFCKTEQRDDNSYNLLTGQSKFSYELTFCFNQLKNGANVRVEINHFCDG